MPNKLLYALFFFSASTYTSASLADTPLLLTDKWILADLGNECRFRVPLPKNSTFRAGLGAEKDYGHAAIIIENLTYFPMTFGFEFACSDAGDEFVEKGWAVKNSYGNWEANSSESVNQLIRLDAFHFFKVTAKNSIGWAVTADDISGDEKLRVRQMTYCLVNKSRSICGQSNIGMLAYIKRSPTADYTQKLLQLLQRIEFVE